MTGPTDIFVSYKAEDRTRLVPLVSALESEGFSVWWDSLIGGGARWPVAAKRLRDRAPPTAARVDSRRLAGRQIGGDVGDSRR